jgi:hypothetical protein
MMQLNLSPQQRISSANSYLKLILDDTVIGALHHAALEMERVATNISQEIVASKSGSGEDGEKNRSNKAPIRFKPMRRDYLHLTLFFGGKDLPALSPAELTKWHEFVSTETKKVTAASSVCIQQMEEQDNLPQDTYEDVTCQFSPDEKCKSVSLTLESFRAFPPRRLNLLVATFNAPRVLHNLYSDILTYSSNEDCKLKSVARRNARGGWIPHVSLGRLMIDETCMGKESKLWTEAIEKILSSGREEFVTKRAMLNTEVYLTQAEAYGVSMGGVVPTQVPLNWNMLF